MNDENYDIDKWKTLVGSDSTATNSIFTTTLMYGTTTLSKNWTLTVAGIISAAFVVFVIVPIAIILCIKLRKPPQKPPPVLFSGGSNSSSLRYKTTSSSMKSMETFSLRRNFVAASPPQKRQLNEAGATSMECSLESEKTLDGGGATKKSRTRPSSGRHRKPLLPYHGKKATPGAGGQQHQPWWVTGDDDGKTKRKNGDEEVNVDIVTDKEFVSRKSKLTSMASVDKNTKIGHPYSAAKMAKQ